MPRLLTTLFLVSSLTLTFGCAMKTKSPSSDTSLQPSSATLPSNRLQEKISEETIIAAPQSPIESEGIFSQEQQTLAGLQVVPFAYDQHLLSDEARNIIAANASVLKAKGRIKFQLAGHCDERGSDQYNIALGERRAEAVRAYLLELGISSDRIETVSYGEEKPLVPGNDESCWMQNRRAEFILRP